MNVRNNVDEYASVINAENTEAVSIINARNSANV